MSAHRFTSWDQLSDQSTMDKLLIFDKFLTQEVVQQIMNGRP